SWWWACESRRGRSRRGSGRGSGLSVVRGRLRGLSGGNRPHFGADQPRRPQPRRPVGNDEQRVGLALDAMGRRLPGVDVPGVLKRSSISSSGDGPTSPGGVAVDRAGGGSGRWLSLSWWWACEARRGRSGRGSGRCSGLSVVRGRLRGLSWGNRPHFGADQPRRPQPRRSMRWADVYVCMLADGVADENSPALIITPQLVYAPPINYMDVAFGIASWTIDVQHHLFYFRRLIDASLPLDVRWLNGYRLLEWHFVGGRTHLPKSREWHEFVGRFGDSLAPHLRPRQTAVGLLEEARATAAHAGIDERPLEDRRRDPRNSMEKTFRVLERMVMTALNEHASRKGSPIRFQPRVPE